MATNPYLQDQADAITGQATRNLQNNIMPGINAGAMAAGGFGGSRQGIAQGLAIGQTNQGLTSALAGMYGSAYQNDQNLAAQQAMAAAQDKTQRDLGFGNLDLGRTQAANQYSLGQQQNANQATANQNNYSLGQGQLGLGYQNSANQYSLGLGQNANQYMANANNYNLGMTQAANQYSLGQGQNSNQATANQNNYNLGLGQLGLGQNTADQNFYTSQRGQDLQQQLNGANISNMANQQLVNQGQQLYNNGQTQFAAPWQNLQNYQNSLQPFTGLNNTNTQSQPGGSVLGGAMAGGLTAAQIYALFNRP
jgi:hypothetical protein